LASDPGMAARGEASPTWPSFGVDRLPAAERRVLVVEDDQATRAFLVDNFTADGLPAVGASGAGEGLRAIEVRQPSLVVLDLGLEDGSGLALLDRVRAADGLASRIDPDLPVIVLSGRAGDADRVRSFARGADDHVCKPTCRYPQRAILVVERADKPLAGLREALKAYRSPGRPDLPLRGRRLVDHPAEARVGFARQGT
jgi:CheY-like chemotaxis protein